ncbi:photosynthetic reaction center cytochrome PufC [Rhodocista pekingensis]|uniref:Photosynthetic reaction center cytochrome c subunit n=1 Tax=Rhodocista pekingensis TaxID=201185 RepID=A0ABW2KWM8_9PROT
MSMTFRIAIAVVVVYCIGLLFTFERPPVDVAQTGYRGLAQQQVTNPRTEAVKVAANKVPAPIEAVDSSGPLAGEIYKNVTVLGDLPDAQFLRLMSAITEWVSPEQGCAYCHVEGEDLAADTLYTKVVSRRMIEMTRHINTKWESHVAQTGVTCYTCHRGQPVPAGIWFTDPGRKHTPGMAGYTAGQNEAAPAVGYAALPVDPFTTFFQGGEKNSIRVISTAALPTDNKADIKQTEATYALMFHLSESMGVNCTFCHNSRSFAQWDQSPPQRATAWYGIRLVRDLNDAYLNPLQSTFPKNRLGPLGDAPKVNCTTCHQGVNKPLYGNASLLAAHPELDREAGVVPAKAPAPQPAPAEQTPPQQ